MPTIIDIKEFINIRKEFLTIDVRSPKEFLQGHIPEAVNLPLFNDTERAKVGTIYKQISKESAIIKGLEIVGPKMSGFVKKVSKWCPNKKVIVHCWRGGKRSGSFAWLLELVGFEVFVIAGGYKKYRQYVLENLNQMQLNLIVLGGKTGSRKTEILRGLKENGEQIIDLEAIANHKGSAFGWIGEANQPSVEHFENMLFHTIEALDITKRVWVENESRSIGSVFIPEVFWNNMKNSPLVNIKIPDQIRLEKLVADYAQCGKEVLIQSFKKIEKKIGYNHFKSAVEFVENEDFISAAKIALAYYDKAYLHSLQNNPTLSKLDIDLDGENLEISIDILKKIDKF